MFEFIPLPKKKQIEGKEFRSPVRFSWINQKLALSRNCTQSNFEKAVRKIKEFCLQARKTLLLGFGREQKQNEKMFRDLGELIL